MSTGPGTLQRAILRALGKVPAGYVVSTAGVCNRLPLRSRWRHDPREVRRALNSLVARGLVGKHRAMDGDRGYVWWLQRE